MHILVSIPLNSTNNVVTAQQVAMFNLLQVHINALVQQYANVVDDNNASVSAYICDSQNNALY